MASDLCQHSLLTGISVQNTIKSLEIKKNNKKWTHPDDMDGPVYGSKKSLRIILLSKQRPDKVSTSII